MKRLVRSTLLASACVLFAGATPLAAQHAQARNGFWFSGGLGYGSLGCDDCDGRTGGLSGGMTFGTTLSPKLLLAVGTSGWTRSEEGASLTTGTFDARLRYYTSETGGFFVTGGLGLGSMRASVSGLGSDTEVGLGVLLGLGYDFRIGSNLSLTPFWNGFAVRTSNADSNVGQLGVGITVH